jgi:hypothetical protein
MKNKLTLVLLLISFVTVGQTNTFPSSGNVGIGTQSPAFKLDVFGNLRTTSFIAAREYLTVDNGGSYRVALNAQIDGYVTGRNNSNEDKFLISSNGNSYFNGGNIGIGTSSPETKLNINQGAGNSVTGTASLRIGGTGNYPSLEFGIKGAYDGMISTFGNDLHIYAGNWRTAGATATENHNISFYTSQTSSTNWNTPKMILRYDGNLGIGTTNPGAKLSLRTSTSTQGIIISNCDAVGYQSHFGLTTADHSSIGTVSESYLNYYNDSKWNLNSSNTSGTTLPIAFSTDGAARLFIKPDGNVGIGTSTPDAKLAVNGTIHGKEVKVDLTGWPDYVFNSDYNLLSLEEIKTYIDKNKHLPEVPTAKEMEANGVQLGEMNMLLLKKIEELTLYQIEATKQIEILKLKVQALESK